MKSKLITLILLLVSTIGFAQQSNNKKLPKKVVDMEVKVPYTIEQLCRFSKMEYKEYIGLKLPDVFLKYELEKIEDDPYLYRVYFYDYNLFIKYLNLLGINENRVWTEKTVDKTRFIIFHKSYDDDGKRLFDEHNRMFFILSITY